VLLNHVQLPEGNVELAKDVGTGSRHAELNVVGNLATDLYFGGKCAIFENIVKLNAVRKHVHVGGRVSLLLDSMWRAYRLVLHAIDCSLLVDPNRSEPQEGSWQVDLTQWQLEGYRRLCNQ
jgi:hypothetical protein